MIILVDFKLLASSRKFPEYSNWSNLLSRRAIQDFNFSQTENSIVECLGISKQFSFEIFRFTLGTVSYEKA